MDIKRTFLALILAPLASLIIWVAMFVQGALAGAEMKVFEGLIIFFMVGFGFLSVSYAFVAFIGLPIHYVLSKLSITHWSAYCAGGVLSVVVYQYIIHLGSSKPAQLQEADYLLYCSCGLVVSIAFWFIAARPHKKAIERDGLQPPLI